MIAVGNVLRRWLEGSANLRSILPDGTGPTVRVDTDPDAEDQGRVKILLSVSMAPSSIRAGVPFSGTVKATFANREDIEIVLEALDAFNERAHIEDTKAAIHIFQIGNRRSEVGPGALPTFTFDMGGTASW
ncbi:MAG TPA: hypothetical protein DCQ64_22295 [Candidatus Rokubacteria bacterium]|nr:hypothetical protein [Candidatus Rokubacteria bacterium]